MRVRTFRRSRPRRSRPRVGRNSSSVAPPRWLQLLAGRTANAYCGISIQIGNKLPQHYGASDQALCFIMPDQSSWQLLPDLYRNRAISSLAPRSIPRPAPRPMPHPASHAGRAQLRAWHAARRTLAAQPLKPPEFRSLQSPAHHHLAWTPGALKQPLACRVQHALPAPFLTSSP